MPEVTRRPSIHPQNQIYKGGAPWKINDRKDPFVRMRCRRTPTTIDEKTNGANVNAMGIATSRWWDGWIAGNACGGMKTGSADDGWWAQKPFIGDLRKSQGSAIDAL
jgi:hypothetical protein